MDTIDFLVALERECAEMIDNLDGAELSAAVPTCPGWTVKDLVVHTGLVHRHKTSIVRDGHTDPVPQVPYDSDGDVVEWFSAGIADMLHVFGFSDLAAPTWTWCDHDHTADWWVRRMAHETLIHGVDLAVAVGVSPHVDEALAEDGISEVLDEYIVGGPKWAEISVGHGSVALRSPRKNWSLAEATWSGTSTDTNVTYEDQIGLVYVDANTSPDVSITASSADLDLWLWGRLDSLPGTIEGDEALLEYVRSVALVATQ